MHPHLWRLLASNSLLTAGVALYTITECARMTFDSGILPAEMRFPPISFFAVRPASPEQSLYARGFVAVAGLFTLSLVPLASFMRSYVEDERRGEVTKLVWVAMLAFAGLAVHGVVPLHPDIIKLVRGQPSTNDGAAQNAIHQGAAAIFFLCSLFHGYYMIQLLKSSTKLPIGVTMGGSGAKLSVWLKVGCLGLQFAPALFSLVMHPASRSALGLEGLALSEQDKGGLTQWWTVGAVAAYYITFSVDAVVIATFEEKQRARVGGQEDGRAGGAGAPKKKKKKKTEHDE
jgi:hypothetical protein